MNYCVLNSQYKIQTFSISKEHILSFYYITDQLPEQSAPGWWQCANTGNSYRYAEHLLLKLSEICRIWSQKGLEVYLYELGVVDSPLTTVKFF